METSLYYALTFAALNRNSNSMESTVDWIRQNIPGILREMSEAGAVTDGRQLRIISIGSGAGEPDAAILDEIIKFKLPVHYTAVDPNSDHMEQFKLRVAGNIKYSGVEFDLREMTAEEYLSANASNEKFHMVFFIHSLYYVYGRVGEVLECFYNLTAKDGIIIAITGEKDSFIRKYEGKLPISDIAWAQDVDIALEHGHLTFKRTEFYYDLNIGPIYECGSEGNLLLDFLTHVPHFRETSDPDFVKDFQEQLKTASVEDDRKIIYPFTILVHTVKKR